MTAIAAMLGAVLPAFAQAPVPAPVYAPAPQPMMAPPPAPMPTDGAVMPVAPVVAPRAADDMTGSIGYGVGVVSGSTSLLSIADTASVMMKYWMSDAMALMPSLSLTMSKTKGADAAWAFNPEVVAMFNLLKGASTRFDVGAGVGLTLGKDPAVSTDTAIGFSIPVRLNVEHFFTRWFAMGLGAGFHLFDFTKLGDTWTMEFEVSNIRYMGSLFFYTD
jgi:hypothetical protein